MDDDEHEPAPRSPWTMAAALFLVLISPVGAPLMGFAMILACDIEWEGVSQCFVPEPVLTYFLVFTVLPWTPAGPLFAILWLGVALAVPSAICSKRSAGRSWATGETSSLFAPLA